MRLFLPIAVCLCASMLAGQELNSRIAYRLSKVEATLAIAERHLELGRTDAARDHLHSAEGQMADVFTMHARELDPEHPAIVATQERIAQLRASLDPAAADPAPDAQPEPDASPPAAPADERALDSRAAYALEKVEASLTMAAASRDGRERERILQGVREALLPLVEADRASYAQLHPRLAASVAQLEQLEAASTRAGVERAALDEVLPALVASLQERFASLQSAIGSAQGQITWLQRGRGDLDRLREQGICLNALVPELMQLAADVRSRFPDPSALARAHDLGPQVTQLLELIETETARWGPIEQQALTGFLAEANSCIDAADGYLREALQEPAMTGPAEQQLAYAWQSCAAVHALRPDTGEGSSDEAQAATAIRERIFAAEKEIARIAQKVIDDEVLRVQRTRFPTTEYPGSEWASIEEEMRQAYLDLAPDREVVRAALIEPWFERTLTYFDDDGDWVVAHVRFCNGYLGVTLPNGKAFVFTINFIQNKAGDGWSKARVNVVNRADQILPEHLATD